MFISKHTNTWWWWGGGNNLVILYNENLPLDTEAFPNINLDYLCGWGWSGGGGR